MKTLSEKLLKCPHKYILSTPTNSLEFTDFEKIARAEDVKQFIKILKVEIGFLNSKKDIKQLSNAIDKLAGAGLTQ